MSRLKMVLVGGLVATTAALALVNDMALGQAGPQTRPAKPPGGDKRPEFPPFDDVVKGMTAIRSTPTDPKLYNLYYDTKKGKLLAEIPSSQLKKDFLLYTSIAGGGFYTGWQYDDVMVRWERRDKRLLLVKPEVRFRSGSGELGDVVKRTYTDTIITTVPILTMKGGNPVIDLGALLGGKARIFVGNLASGTDASLMSFPPEALPKAFPQNVEIELKLPRVTGSMGTGGGTFHSMGAGGGTLIIHYSISSLPKSSYKPREADDRIGYFLTVAKDFTRDPRDDTRFVRYINRWHIEKDDPKAKLSLAKNPIIFYVEKTVPKKYRRWVHEGILEWNKAFEKIGILRAIEVRQQLPDNEYADLDPEDRRYNFFRWITSERAFAMGPSRVNPKTGEILDADIIMDDSFVRALLQNYGALIQQGPMTRLSPRLRQYLENHPERHPMRRWLAQELPEDQPQFGDYMTPPGMTSLGPLAHACQIGAGLQHQMAFGMTAYQVLFAGADEDDDDEADEKDDEDGEEKEEKSDDEDDAEESEKDGDDKDEADAEKDDKKDEKKDESDKDDEKKKADAKSKPEWPDAFIGQVLKEVVMHEVGHTLGLRHNFKASSWLSLEQINEKKMGEPTVGSVMDYNPTNVSPKGKKQGLWTTTTLGPYDDWAIEYGYTTDGSAKNLKKIASRVAEAGLAYATDEDVFHSDPLVNRFDLGDDPLAYSKQRFELVEQILDKLVDNFVKEGDGYQRVRRAFGMLMYEYMRGGAVAAKYVGGHYMARDHKGDPDARPPVRVVEAAKQRAALEMLADHIFSPTAFKLSPKLINHLAAGRWNHWGSRDWAMDTEYRVHDVILRIQSWALFDLLNGDTLTRLLDAQMRVNEDDDLLTIPELFGTLNEAIFSEVVKPLPPDGEWTNRKPFIGSIRRNLQRKYVSELIDLALEASYGYSPQVARTQAWYQLKKLSGQLSEKLRPEQARTIDEYTIAHLDETRTRIDKALEAMYSLNGSGGSGGFFFRIGRQAKPQPDTSPGDPRQFRRARPE